MMDEAVPPAPLALPLPLGTRVAPYGEVAAVVWTGGERYYMLTDGRDVALMPWFAVESRNSGGTHR